MAAKPALAPEREFTTNEVAERLGVTLRQLQWADERRVVPVRKEGHRRIYTERDVVRIYVLRELRRAGLRWKAVGLMKRLERLLWQEHVEFLVIGGKQEVRGAKDYEGLVGAVLHFSRAGKQSFVVDLGEVDLGEIREKAK